MRRLIAVLVVLGCLLAVQPCDAQSQDFNALVMEKVLHMLNTEPMPETIRIIYHDSQQEFLRFLENERYKECLEHSNPFDPASRAYCSQVSKLPNAFLWGLTLLKENSRENIVIHVYRSPGGVRMETVIHELMHWWLQFQTTPEGFLNSEEATQLLTLEVITSDEFKAWLDTQEKNQ